MGLRIVVVTGIGLTSILGACATSQQVPTQPSVNKAVASSTVATTAPVDDPFGVGAAGTDTIGGSMPDGRSLSPFDVTNPAVAWLDPPLLTAVQNAARAAQSDGVDIRVASGWRSKGFQQRLFDEAVQTYGSVDIARQYVASPDESKHVTGHAVDVGPAAGEWLIRNGSQFGLCQIYANETWHFELATDPSGNCPPLKANAAAE